MALRGTGEVAQVPATPDPAPGGSPTSPVGVPSRGVHQAGVDRPATPQHSSLLIVADAHGVDDRAAVRELLAATSEAVDALTDPARADQQVLPDGPGNLVVTIGIGPRLVELIDPALPGTEALPVFASDGDLDPAVRGGDLLVAVYSSDAAVLRHVADAVLAAYVSVTQRWAQWGARGAGQGTVSRNPLGYHDGIIVPHTQAELDQNVWITSGPAAGGTIAVIRRLRLDIESFTGRPVTEQDAIVGRTKREGRPLSGGEQSDEVNLQARSAEGEYLVPLRSHVRAAHPSFTASALMLRRGYGFSNAVPPGAPADDGLTFVCFQRDLASFTRTQHRLDELDDLMTFTTVTASASFLIVPGRTGDEALGTALFA